MELGRSTFYQRGSGALREGARRFWQWPWSIRVCWTGVALLILGTFGPWETYGNEYFAPPYDYQPGLDFASGMLAIGIGILTGFVLAAVMRGHRSRNSPAIAGLGLVAVGIIAAKFGEIGSVDVGNVPGPGDGSAPSPGWGLYVSAVGALALFLAGVNLFISNAPTGRAR